VISALADARNAVHRVLIKVLWSGWCGGEAGRPRPWRFDAREAEGDAKESNPLTARQPSARTLASDSWPAKAAAANEEPACSVVTNRMPAFTHSIADAARKPNTKTVEQETVTSDLEALVVELRLAWNAAWVAERDAWRKLSEAERSRYAAEAARRRAERDAIRAAEATK